MPSVEQTATQIANLALAHCGVSKPIGNLATEKSLEGQMCRTFFDIARQETLREFPWLFAKKQIAPSLVASQPTPEWMYAYQYPADALKIIRFMSWRLNNDTKQSRVPYTIMQPVSVNLSQLATPPTSYAQSTGQWIYTNWPGVNSSPALPTIIEYIFDNTDVSQWTADFTIALSYKLADFMVMTLTSGDPQKYKETIAAEYQAKIGAAKADNLNEEQRPEEPQSEFIRARGGDAFGYPGMNWIAEPSGFNIQ